MAQKYPEPPRISDGKHDWVSPEEFKRLEEKYTFALVKEIRGQVDKGETVIASGKPAWKVVATPLRRRCDRCASFATTGT